MKTMGKKEVKQLTLVLILSGICWAQPAYQTGPMLNGRYWQALNATERGIFVRAFSEGLNVGLLEASAKQDALKLSMDKFMAGELSASEVAKGIDLFYSDPSNIRVPILAAMRWFRDKCKGKSVAELELMAEWYRYNAAEQAAK